LLRPTDATEIAALFGLWLSLGLHGFDKIPIKEIFSTKKGVASFGRRYFRRQSLVYF
jgi:hypothetical protein